MNKFKEYCEALLKETEDRDEQEAIMDVLNAISLQSKLALEQHMDVWRFWFHRTFDIYLANQSDLKYASMTDKLRDWYRRIC